VLNSVISLLVFQLKFNFSVSFPVLVSVLGFLIFSRPYLLWSQFCYCVASVLSFCIVAKRCVLEQVTIDSL